ncbi:cell division protein ZapA [Vallitalea guaymasensis]|uniref:cell division protein ZapA n=1 Tax=Vallitalea guaymasensis TaxID=1185412 RepID=UPI002353A982|nr:cell division protein ZapA [Vallitalea guaymasensis]
MSPKNNTKVIIGGNVYTLSGDESEEYIQRVALYINNKLDELKASENGQFLNTRLMSILLAINIADDYFKTKEGTVNLEKSFKLKDELILEKEREIERLQETIHKLEADKNELIERADRLEEDMENYKAELDEYIETFDLENG